MLNACASQLKAESFRTRAQIYMTAASSEYTRFDKTHSDKVLLDNSKIQPALREMQ